MKKGIVIILVLFLLAACKGTETTTPGATATTSLTPGDDVSPNPTASPLPQPQPNPNMDLVPGPGDSPISLDNVPEGVIAAVQFLAEELQIPATDISLLSYQEVEWNDSSLGCPQPGMAYLQIITPGYSVVLQAGGQTYEIHVNRSGGGAVDCSPTTDAQGGPQEIFEAFLAYLERDYPGFGLEQQARWRSKLTTPPGLVGASTWEWQSGEWTLSITYPVVPHPTYKATLIHTQAGTVWSGSLVEGEQVQADGYPVTLTSEVGECEESPQPGQALHDWANVQVTVQDGVVQVQQHLSYVCCAEVVLSVGQDGNNIKLVETNVGEVCRCECGYNINASLSGLPSGTYIVQVWGVQYMDTHSLAPLGYTEVTIP